MKPFLKKIFAALGLLTRFKYSRFYLWYKRATDVTVAAAYTKEYNFYASFLQKGELIFDIGANDGHKTEVFLHLADKVICCEPDATNYKILKARFGNNKRVSIENKAVAKDETVHTMFVHEEGSAFNTLNAKFKNTLEGDRTNRWDTKVVYEKEVEINTTTLDHLIQKYGVPGFIKIDVEGYENEVMKGLTQAIPFISIECLLPEFEAELLEIIERLEQLQHNLSFNVAIDEKLVFTGFLAKDAFLNYLNENPDLAFETIIKTEA